MITEALFMLQCIRTIFDGDFLKNWNFAFEAPYTVGSKIIRALEIIWSENSYLMQFYEINVC